MRALRNLESDVTFQNGDELARHSGSSGAQVLPGGHLLKEDGYSAGKHGYEVNEEECPSAVLVAEIGEPPDVAQADGDGNAGEEKILEDIA